MNLKEYIKSLVRKQLEETSTSVGSGVGMNIATPNWVAPKGQKINAATKTAKKQGFTVARKIYELGTTDVNAEFSVTTKDGKTVNAIYKGVRPTGELMFDPGVNKGGIIFISPEDVNSKVKKIQFESKYTQASDYTKASPSSNPSLYLQKSQYGAESGYSMESLANIVKEELLNEVTYHKFRNEVKFRTKNEILHKAIREVKRKLSEIDRIVEYTSRMKQELSEGEEGLQYWKKTESNIATISEMVNALNNKIKNLH
jgi:hypothetical protein